MRCREHISRSMIQPLSFVILDLFCLVWTSMLKWSPNLAAVSAAYSPASLVLCHPMYASEVQVLICRFPTKTPVFLIPCGRPSEVRLENWKRDSTNGAKSSVPAPVPVPIPVPHKSRPGLFSPPPPAIRVTITLIQYSIVQNQQFTNLWTML